MIFASLRQLRHSLLLRLIARVTILVLLAGFLPADARASIPASPAVIDSYTLPDLAPAALASAGDVLVRVVVVVAAPSGLTKSAFGELVAHSGPDPQPYAFTSEPLDPNSGFQHHRARWLDTRTGRFTVVATWECFGVSALRSPFSASVIALPVHVISRRLFDMLHAAGVRPIEFQPIEIL